MAVMAGLPPLEAEFVKVANPFVLSGLCARKVGPFQNETIPVSLLVAGASEDTRAMEVTAPPGDGAELVNVKDVALA